MNKKAFANVFLIIPVAVIIGAVGYFALRKLATLPANQPEVASPTTQPSAPTQTQTNPAPTPNPTLTDEIANWKIYTNTKYKFSISHPKDWYTRENQFAHFFRYAISSKPLKISNDAGGESRDLVDTFIIFANPTFEDFIGGRRNSEKDTSLKTYLENGSKIQALQYKTISFNNMPAYLIGVGRSPEIFEVVVEQGKKIYSISLPYGVSDPTQLLATQKQVLSTFKFAD